jgi:hypothetical protein
VSEALIIDGEVSRAASLAVSVVKERTTPRNDKDRCTRSRYQRMNSFRSPVHKAIQRVTSVSTSHAGTSGFSHSGPPG